MQRILVIRGGAVGDTDCDPTSLGGLTPGISARQLIETPGQSTSRAILAQHPHYVDRITDLERWDLYRLFSQHPTLSEGHGDILEQPVS